jgi:Uma2 family endonuclease
MSTVRTSPPVTRVEPDPQSRRWTRAEYYQMAELGWFRGQRAELIDGEILVLSPQGPSHSYVTDQASEVIRDSGWTGVWVRMQLPIDLGPYSEPEPDVSVVAGTREDYKTAHPQTALLIIEVSDSTLAYDRGRKASLYALLGIADYWIINLVNDQLEVRRNPVPDASQPFGFAYADVTILTAGAHVVPLAAPTVRIAVADLVP